MLPENVQPKRDSLKNCLTITETNPDSQNDQISFASPSDSEHSFGKQLPQSSCHETQPSTSAFMPISVLSYHPLMPRKSIIKRIEEGYRRLCEARHAAELTLSQEPLRNVFTKNSTSVPKPGNFENTNRIRRADIPLIADFLENAFDEFAGLVQEQKWAVFHNFVFQLWGIESCFRTARRFPEAGGTQMMLTQNTFVDIDNIEDFFEPHKQINEDVARLIKSNFTVHIAVADAMRRLKLTDSEFAALIAITLWSEGIKGASQETAQVARKARSAVLCDLHRYYTEELGVPDYASRLGEALIVLGASEKGMQQASETMELAKLFDLFAVDSFLYDFIKG